jgi:alanyl-tRNA synthetase
MYIVLDHTRTVLMAVEDGSLPSNVGGASNVRNILRRVFHVLHKNKGSPGKPASPDSASWWTQIGELEGLLQIFRKHKEDLATVYGEFPPYKSFDEIIKIEYERWCSTDDGQKAKLVKILQKRSGKLLLEDWIVAVTSWGLPADKIGEIAGLAVPETLYYEIAQQQERSAKPMPTVLYNTSHLAATESMYYGDHHCYDFEAKILAVLPNVERKMEPSVVVLDQSAFYPTSGGQEHDTGTLTIGGTVYQVVDALKVGPCVLHIVSPPLPSDLASYVGQSITGHVDEERRAQLRNHHTATHIVFASCRRVLGPHVWQHGAKKTTEKGHLDITHYRSLTHEEVAAIEAEANRIVSSAKDISKSWMPKDEAEKKHGFHLYQGR